MNHSFQKILLLTFTLFAVGSIIAQENYRIKFEVDKYDRDDLLIGYYYGDKTLIKDTIYRNDKNQFILSGEDTLNAGVYLALTIPDNKFFQFFVNENEKFFEVVIDTSELDSPQFMESPDNERFYKYMSYLKKQRPKAESIDKKIKTHRAEQNDVSDLEVQLKALNEDVRKQQLAVIQEDSSSITALMIGANIPIELPEFEGAEDSVQLQKYLWYKSHYFDNLDLGNPVSLFTPIMHQRIDYYLEKLTPLHPDSIIISLDYLLHKLKPAPESYRYYLSHFLNKYAASKFIGFDAIYVHLSENYYAKGEAPWVSEENLKKIVDNAIRLKPLLIGKIAPDFTVYTEDNEAVTLSELDAEYTVLVFWAPDCGHCEKAMPSVLAFEKDFKQRGVKLISICNKTGQKYEECWKSVRDKGMEALLNVGDQYQRSRILANYYVKKTPMIYVLDKDRKIVLKNIAGEKLAESMEAIMQSNGKL
jgi:thiol-disulfide isomerase/thioredoxin